jgi:hypothetical protein
MANQGTQAQIGSLLAEAERKRNEQEMTVNTQTAAQQKAFQDQMIALYNSSTGTQAPTLGGTATPVSPVAPAAPTTTTSAIKPAPPKPATFPSLSPTPAKPKNPYNIKPGLGYN